MGKGRGKNSGGGMWGSSIDSRGETYPIRGGEGKGVKSLADAACTLGGLLVPRGGKTVWVCGERRRGGKTAEESIRIRRGTLERKERERSAFYHARGERTCGKEREKRTRCREGKSAQKGRPLLPLEGQKKGETIVLEKRGRDEHGLCTKGGGKREESTTSIRKRERGRSFTPRGVREVRLLKLKKESEKGGSRKRGKKGEL